MGLGQRDALRTVRSHAGASRQEFTFMDEQNDPSGLRPKAALR